MFLRYGHSAPALPAVRTDADGRFRIDGVGPERVADLIARSPGSVATRIRVLTRLGDGKPVIATGPGPKQSFTSRPTDTFRPARFEQALAPSRPIAGTITDAGTGHLLAG